MKLAKYHQLQQEFMSWQRSLEFFKQENALLKYRLSEMADDTGIVFDLASAEHFQNEFIHIDEMLENLSKSLLNFSQTSSFEKDRTAISGHDVLRESMHALEKKCLNLALEFNKKMLSSPRIN
ncbi:MAG: hypothetical protein ABIY35_09295 [Chitinophagaceae bacterium]